MFDTAARLYANVAAYFDDPYWTDAELHNFGVFLAWTGGIILVAYFVWITPDMIREHHAVKAHNARLDAYLAAEADARAEAACRQADADLADWIADTTDLFAFPADDVDVYALCRECADAPVMDEAEARLDDDPTLCRDCNRAAWDRLMAGDFSDCGLSASDLAPAVEPAGWEGAPSLLFGHDYEWTSTPLDRV